MSTFNNILNLSYRVAIHSPEHELQIELMIERSEGLGELCLELPSWVPGDYSFMTFARDLFELTAVECSSGAALKVLRTGWQSFAISASSGSLVVSYRAYAYSLDRTETCGIVDSEYAIVMGTRYLRPVRWNGSCTVSYQLPLGWRIHHPSGAVHVGDCTWRYPSYLTLVDTPVVMGQFSILSRAVQGTRISLIFVDRALGYEDGVERFADSLAAIAEQYHRIFGRFPFDDYTFVLSCSPNADWGLEHLSSTLCGLGTDLFIDSRKYAFAARLCAHELFHAWNIRRLRPSPLTNINLKDGTFTEGLWVSEGFTRYYEFVVCARIGLYSVEQIVSVIVNCFIRLAAVPAFQRVSVVDSSLATFVNHNKYSGRCNNSIDYYDKGMLIAFDIDMALRLGTASDSLDKAFADFYYRFVDSHEGFTTGDVVRFFEGRLSGLGTMIAREVEGTDLLSVEGNLQRLGFVVGYRDQKYIGLLFSHAVNGRIYDVLDDSPAGRSGIAPEDQITRINGYPFSGQGLRWACSHSDGITLEVLRGQRTLAFAMTPERRREIGSVRWQGSEEQAERIRRWLEHDKFRPLRGQLITLEFYENFHGIDVLV